MTTVILFGFAYFAVLTCAYVLGYQIADHMWGGRLK